MCLGGSDKPIPSGILTFSLFFRYGSCLPAYFCVWVLPILALPHRNHHPRHNVALTWPPCLAWDCIRLLCGRCLATSCPFWQYPHCLLVSSGLPKRSFGGPPPCWFAKNYWIFLLSRLVCHYISLWLLIFGEDCRSSG